MEIKKYTTSYEKELFNMFRDEGEDWREYYEYKAEEYKNALNNSITYIALKDNKICGYVRCREDYGFGVYVYDLLVSKKHRGNNIGRKLMERVYDDYPDQICYAMSDEDGYYIKQGYKIAGTIFIVQKH